MRVRNWTCIGTMAAATTLALASASFGGVCGGATNDCCFPSQNGTPGCNDLDCCTLICSIDPFCCSAAWDGLCSGAALQQCVVCEGTSFCPPSGNDCCVPSGDGTPGCNDATCCDAVCAADAFCCSVAWDGLCSGAAAGLCVELCGIDCDTSCPAGGEQEGEACGNDDNGGCNNPGLAYGSITPGTPLCGNFWAEGGTRDTDWLSFSTGTTSDVTLSVLAGIPVVIGLLDGNCPPFIFSLIAVTACPAEVTFCLPAGDHTAFVAPGFFDGLPCGTGEINDYVATLTVGGECVAIGCGSPETGDCCSANGTPFCNDADCCELICAQDPFCCTVAWDGICSGAALAQCAVCEGVGGCPDSANDCCVPSADGTPGCNDPECCDAVCAADPFCCSVAWDGLCSGAAAGLCVALCGVDCDTSCPAGGEQEGEACGNDDNGGCNNPGLAYGSITPGTPLCGNFWAEGGTRDTDWLSFSTAGTAEVSLSVLADIPVVIGILDANCPPFIHVLLALTGCPSEVSACLDAGDYTAFVAPGFFDGLPCGSGEGNEYVATLTVGADCEPLGCGSEGSGSCCAPNGTPFCDDAACCETVCAVDAFCCSVAWDGICAGEALSLCGDLCTGGVENDECETATPVNVGANPVSNVGASGSFTLPASCDKGFGVEVNNTVFYTYVATGSGLATVSTCNSVNFDSRLAIFSGPCDNQTFVACNDDGPGCAGFTSLVTFEAVCGESYTILLGSFGAGATGNGTMTITQLGECDDCLGDLDADGDVDASDLAILLGQWNGSGSADLDNSGSVNAADLAILLGAWGDC